MTDNLESHTRICCQMEAIAGSVESTLDARLTRLAAFMERRLDMCRPRTRAVGRSRSTDSQLPVTKREWHGLQQQEDLQARDCSWTDDHLVQPCMHGIDPITAFICPALGLPASHDAKHDSSCFSLHSSDV